MEHGNHGYRHRGHAINSPSVEASGTGISGAGVAAAAAAAAATGDGLPPPTTVDVREQDHYMPIANVVRIMRRVLPTHAMISDDAKETIQECVSEFVSFVTGEANDRCQRERRKTVTAEDILWEMARLGFDDYLEPVTVFLNRYRKIDCGRTSLRGEPFVKRTVEYAPATMVPQPPALPKPYMAAPAFHHTWPDGAFGGGSVGYYGVEGPPCGGAAACSSSSAYDAALLDSFDPYAQFKS